MRDSLRKIAERPAFPTLNGEEDVVIPGITFREYLIGQVLAGVAHHQWDVQCSLTAMDAGRIIAAVDTVLTHLQVEADEDDRRRVRMGEGDSKT